MQKVIKSFGLGDGWVLHVACWANKKGTLKESLYNKLSKAESMSSIVQPSINRASPSVAEGQLSGPTPNTQQFTPQFPAHVLHSTDG